MESRERVGSVYQRTSDGRWVAAIRVEGRKVVRYANTRAGAEEQLQKLRAEVEAGFTPLAVRLTFGEWFDLWFDLQAASMPGGWADRYRVHVRPFRRLFESTWLERVTAVRLAQALLILRGQVAPHRLRLGLIAIKISLDDAVALGSLRSNPAHRVATPMRVRVRVRRDANRIRMLKATGSAGQFGERRGTSRPAGSLETKRGKRRRRSI